MEKRGQNCTAPYSEGQWNHTRVVVLIIKACAKKCDNHMSSDVVYSLGTFHKPEHETLAAMKLCSSLETGRDYSHN